MDKKQTQLLFGLTFMLIGFYHIFFNTKLILDNLNFAFFVYLLVMIGGLLFGSGASKTKTNG